MSDILPHVRRNQGGERLAELPQTGCPPQQGGLKILQVPICLLPVYAALLLTLGWQCGQRWNERQPALPAVKSLANMHTVAAHLAAAVTPVMPPAAKTDRTGAAASLAEEAVPPGELPPLRYSSHVYASEGSQRSITLNGKRYVEGDSPAPGLLIEQIQQDLTIFNFNGEVFTLAALADWPGGKMAEDAAQ